MPIRLTPPMKQRLTRRTLAMLQRSLGYFPELRDHSITVGYTRKYLGSATVIYRKGTVANLIIRLRARKVTYQTIGHELTHLIQALAFGDRAGRRSSIPGRIPSGEKQCDIWTLAREPLFCDDAPTYIKMPRTVRDHWPDYAEAVRELCISSIEKRDTERQYIRWLEDQIAKLPAAHVRKKLPGTQLMLPW